MVEVIDLQDHRLLESAARRQGLTYSQYRKLLRERGIPLETAMKRAQIYLVLYATSRAEENSAGIDVLDSRIATLEEESRERKAKEDKRFGRGYRVIVGGAIAASIVALFVTIVTPTPSRYERALNNYRQANVAVETYRATNPRTDNQILERLILQRIEAEHNLGKEESSEFKLPPGLL